MRQPLRRVQGGISNIGVEHGNLFLKGNPVHARLCASVIASQRREARYRRDVACYVLLEAFPNDTFPNDGKRDVASNVSTDDPMDSISAADPSCWPGHIP